MRRSRALLRQLLLLLAYWLLSTVAQVQQNTCIDISDTLLAPNIPSLPGPSQAEVCYKLSKAILLDQNATLQDIPALDLDFSAAMIQTSASLGIVNCTIRDAILYSNDNGPPGASFLQPVFVHVMAQGSLMIRNSTIVTSCSYVDQLASLVKANRLPGETQDSKDQHTIIVDSYLSGALSMNQVTITCDPAHKSDTAYAAVSNGDELQTALSVLAHLTDFQAQVTLLDHISLFGNARDTWPVSGYRFSRGLKIVGALPTQTVLDLAGVPSFVQLASGKLVQLQNLQMQGTCVKKVVLIPTLNIFIQSTNDLWPIYSGERFTPGPRVSKVIETTNCTLLNTPQELYGAFYWLHLVPPPFPQVAKYASAGLNGSLTTPEIAMTSITPTSISYATNQASSLGQFNTTGTIQLPITIDRPGFNSTYVYNCLDPTQGYFLDDPVLAKNETIAPVWLLHGSDEVARTFQTAAEAITAQLALPLAIYIPPMVLISGTLTIPTTVSGVLTKFLRDALMYGPAIPASAAVPGNPTSSTIDTNRVVDFVRMSDGGQAVIYITRLTFTNLAVKPLSFNEPDASSGGQVDASSALVAFPLWFIRMGDRSVEAAQIYLTAVTIQLSKEEWKMFYFAAARGNAWKSGPNDAVFSVVQTFVVGSFKYSQNGVHLAKFEGWGLNATNVWLVPVEAVSAAELAIQELPPGTGGAAGNAVAGVANNESDHKSVGGIVGAAVGGTVGTIVVVALLFTLLRRSIKNRLAGLCPKSASGVLSRLRTTGDDGKAQGDPGVIDVEQGNRKSHDDVDHDDGSNPHHSQPHAMSVTDSHGISTPFSGPRSSSLDRVDVAGGIAAGYGKGVPGLAKHDHHDDTPGTSTPGAASRAHTSTSPPSSGSRYPMSISSPALISQVVSHHHAKSRLGSEVESVGGGGPSRSDATVDTLLKSSTCHVLRTNTSGVAGPFQVLLPMDSSTLQPARRSASAGSSVSTDPNGLATRAAIHRKISKLQQRASALSNDTDLQTEHGIPSHTRRSSATHPATSMLGSDRVSGMTNYLSPSHSQGMLGLGGVSDTSGHGHAEHHMFDDFDGIAGYAGVAGTIPESSQELYNSLQYSLYAPHLAREQPQQGQQPEHAYPQQADTPAHTTASAAEQQQQHQEDTAVDNSPNAQLCDASFKLPPVSSKRLRSDGLSLLAGAVQHTRQAQPQQQQQQSDVSSKSSGVINTPGSSESAGSEKWDPKKAVAQMAQCMQSDGDNLVLLEPIGKGGFGAVYRGRWRGLDVAIKTVLFTCDGGAGAQQRAITEAAVCSSVMHHNVVATYYYDIVPVSNGSVVATGARGMVVTDLTKTSDQPNTDWKLYLVQEYCHASLYTVLTAKLMHPGGRPDMDLLLTTLIDIAQGMRYLHSKNILHGDLKPENVLLKNDASAPIGVVSKITDFGLSFTLEPTATHVSNITNGTPFYAAPEVIRRGQLSKASDVFSFGVLMWEMHNAQPPWIKTRDGYHMSPNFPKFPAAVPFPFVRLTFRCLDHDPHARPDFTTILAQISAMHSAYLEGYDSLVVPATVYQGSVQQKQQLQQLVSALSNSQQQQQQQIHALIPQYPLVQPTQLQQQQQQIVFPAAVPVGRQQDGSVAQVGAVHAATAMQADWPQHGQQQVGSATSTSQHGSRPCDVAAGNTYKRSADCSLHGDAGSHAAHGVMHNAAGGTTQNDMGPAVNLTMCEDVNVGNVRQHEASLGNTTNKNTAHQSATGNAPATRELLRHMQVQPASSGTSTRQSSDSWTYS